MKTLITIFLLISLTLLTSCTSARKRARKHMEAKDWLSARMEWVNVLKDDPADEEALAGKENAEFNMTADLSVQMRDKRVGGDIYGALDSGVRLKRLHASWNRRNSDINMANFRKEELTKLFPHYLNILELDIKKKAALKGAYDYENYHELFSAYDQVPMIKRKERLNKLGEKECHQMKKSGLQYPYWRRFVKKYCDYFKVDISKYHEESAKIGTELFSDLQISKENNFGIFPLTAEFENVVIKSFKSSPWYNPAGSASAVLNFRGDLSSNTTSYPGKKTHGYWLEKDGKREWKEIDYKVMMMKQTLKLAVQANITIGDSIYKLPLKKNHDFEDYSYEGNSELDIPSKEAAMLNPEQWALESLGDFEKLVKDNIIGAWTKKYCTLARSTSKKSLQGDHIMRCSLSAKYAQSNLINGWYKKHFKVTEDQAAYVLKI